jgi:hypothetical protein
MLNVELQATIAEYERLQEAASSSDKVHRTNIRIRLCPYLKKRKYYYEIEKNVL